MPDKMFKQCRATGCVGLTRERYCEKHAYLESKRRAETSRHYNATQRDPTAQKFYDSPAWRKVRQLKMNRSPFCEICSAKNRFAKAGVVDHIVEIRDGGAPLDLENLQSLCRACHNQKTKAEMMKRKGEYKF